MIFPTGSPFRVPAAYIYMERERERWSEREGRNDSRKERIRESGDKG